MIADKIRRVRTRLANLSHVQCVALGIYGVTAVAALFLIVALASIFKSSQI